jgi:hypothetical protein
MDQGSHIAVLDIPTQQESLLTENFGAETNNEEQKRMPVKEW